VSTLLVRAFIGQFEASLSMLDHAIGACPDEHWDLPVAKYPFWLVAYHTLYCTDGYLVREEALWKPHPTFHPGGSSDIENEYPSKRFTKTELHEYVQFVVARAREVIGQETDASLAGPSGFARLQFSRAELHLYNLRHIAHHTGQLGAVLHRLKIPAPWVKTGWTRAASSWAAECCSMSNLGSTLDLVHLKLANENDISIWVDHAKLAL
jgi:uncharacterized damage-inducible protein DinB